MIPFRLLSLLAFVIAVSASSTAEAGSPDPIAITTWHELQAMNENLGGHYELMTDLDEDSPGYLDVNGGKGFTPIGFGATCSTPGQSFTGSFNGNGFTIAGLRCHRPERDFVGLFGSVFRASVKNVRIVRAEMTGHKYVGIVAGFVTDAFHYRTSLADLQVEGTIDARDVAAGGICGRLYDTKIVRCSAEVDISGTNSVGGLVGSYSFSEMHECTAKARVAASEKYAGGLIGTASATSFKPLVVKSCAFRGTVRGPQTSWIVNSTASDHLWRVENCVGEEVTLPEKKKRVWF